MDRLAERIENVFSPIDAIDMLHALEALSDYELEDLTVRLLCTGNVRYTQKVLLIEVLSRLRSKSS